MSIAAQHIAHIRRGSDDVRFFRRAVLRDIFRFIRRRGGLVRNGIIGHIGAAVGGDGELAVRRLDQNGGAGRDGDLLALIGVIPGEMAKGRVKERVIVKAVRAAALLGGQSQVKALDRLIKACEPGDLQSGEKFVNVPFLAVQRTEEAECGGLVPSAVEALAVFRRQLGDHIAEEKIIIAVTDSYVTGGSQNRPLSAAKVGGCVQISHPIRFAAHIHGQRHRQSLVTSAHPFRMIRKEVIQQQVLSFVDEQVGHRRCGGGKVRRGGCVDRDMIGALGFISGSIISARSGIAAQNNMQLAGVIPIGDGVPPPLHRGIHTGIDQEEPACRIKHIAKSLANLRGLSFAVISHLIRQPDVAMLADIAKRTGFAGNTLLGAEFIGFGDRIERFAGFCHLHRVIPTRGIIGIDRIRLHLVGDSRQRAAALRRITGVDDQHLVAGEGGPRPARLDTFGQLRHRSGGASLLRCRRRHGQQAHDQT